eukprot:Cvel_27460.t1-p1 / transcript=Cvel_27460.t1 / gene=Cvel_27460 / organism=Chromera_velia_CCMP2878 / gene_product=hypothetical protein / transcript_product=hypothetical protein / location=Cvel_scaffold3429:2840-3751(+) / protein_length=304 / sequence_SO=supercontig / SO=protein_coding / is_pseudo=false
MKTILSLFRDEAVLEGKSEWIYRADAFLLGELKVIIRWGDLNETVKGIVHWEFSAIRERMDDLILFYGTPAQSRAGLVLRCFARYWELAGVKKKNEWDPESYNENVNLCCKLLIEAEGSKVGRYFKESFHQSQCHLQQLFDIAEDDFEMPSNLFENEALEHKNKMDKYDYLQSAKGGGVQQEDTSFIQGHVDRRNLAQLMSALKIDDQGGHDEELKKREKLAEKKKNKKDSAKEEFRKDLLSVRLLRGPAATLTAEKEKEIEEVVASVEKKRKIQDVQAALQYFKEVHLSSFAHEPVDGDTSMA